jgi:methylglutaconyl-CoA hydratase
VPEAKFGYTEVKIGFIPAMVLIFLVRKIGEKKARHLLLSGALVQGADALEFGLTNFVVPREKLDDDVNAFAGKLIANNSAHSMMLTKMMIDRVQEMSLKDALDYAARMNAEARASDDCKKGINAFLNKEELRW